MTTDLETRLDRLMKDKRDRRVAIHYGTPPVCATTATTVPHFTRRAEQVTCKRCLHLMAPPPQGNETEGHEPK